MNSEAISASGRARSASVVSFTDRPADLPVNIEKMFETFHQTSKGDFKPTFYNPFEIKHRRRTTKTQFRVLEAAFQENNKPTATARRTLASKLGMTPRAVQVWFQNRRAKSKHQIGCQSDSPQKDSNGHSSADTLASPHMPSTHLSLPPSRRPSITGTSSSAGKSSVAGSGLMIRRHSVPSIQPVGNINLPFKELHEAIFGKGKSISEQRRQQQMDSPMIINSLYSGALDMSNVGRNAIDQNPEYQHPYQGGANLPNLSQPLDHVQTYESTTSFYDPMIGSASHCIVAGKPVSVMARSSTNHMGYYTSAPQIPYEGFGAQGDPDTYIRTTKQNGTDYYGGGAHLNPDSLSTLLFPHQNMDGSSLPVNPMELLSCSNEPYLYHGDYTDDCIVGSRFE